MATLYQVVGTQAYIDPAVYAQLNAKQQVTLISEIIQLKLTPLVQTVFAPEFNGLRDFELLYRKNPETFVKDVSEMFGVTPTNPSIMSIRDHLQESTAALTALQLTSIRNFGYNLSDPLSEEEAKSIIITNRSIRRSRCSADSENQITAEGFKTLFNYVLKEDWKRGEVTLRLPHNREGYSLDSSLRRVCIYPDRLEVGCQTLTKQEVDHIAICLGFNGLPFKGK